MTENRVFATAIAGLYLISFLVWWQLGGGRLEAGPVSRFTAYYGLAVMAYLMPCALADLRDRSDDRGPWKTAGGILGVLALSMGIVYCTAWVYLGHVPRASASNLRELLSYFTGFSALLFAGGLFLLVRLVAFDHVFNHEHVQADHPDLRDNWHLHAFVAGLGLVGLVVFGGAYLLIGALG